MALQVGQVEGEPLEQAFERYPRHEERFRLFLDLTPSTLPPTAVPVSSFVDTTWIDEPRLVARRSPSGELVGHKVVVSGAPSPLVITLLCLVNGDQRPCSDDADVWKTEARGRVVTQFPFRLAVDAGDRVDFVRMIDGDDSRPLPASGSSWVFVEQVQLPEVHGSLAAAERVIAGCDLATFVLRGDDGRWSFAVRDLTKEGVGLAVELCEGDGRLVQLVPIGDRGRVLELDGSDGWTRVMRLEGTSLLLSMPDPGAGISELQVVVLVHSVEGGHALVTGSARTE